MSPVRGHICGGTLQKDKLLSGVSYNYSSCFSLSSNIILKTKPPDFENPSVVRLAYKLQNNSNMIVQIVSNIPNAQRDNASSDSKSYGDKIDTVQRLHEASDRCLSDKFHIRRISESCNEGNPFPNWLSCKTAHKVFDYLNVEHA